MTNVKRINNPEEEVKYFKDEKSAYEFFLTKMDGHQRHDILQITEGMYSDKDAAKKWYDGILAKLGDNPNNDALLKLDYMYKTMTDYWDSEEDNLDPFRNTIIDTLLSEDRHAIEKILGVTDLHYETAHKDFVDAWYKRYSEVIGDSPAINVLKVVYGEMIASRLLGEEYVVEPSGLDGVVKNGFEGIELTTDRFNQPKIEFNSVGKDELLRVRFEIDGDDPRPVKWPIRHPYWVTAQTDTGFFIVSYARNDTDIFEFWPEAKNITASSIEKGYEFNSRFERPYWLKEDNTIMSAEEMESIIDEGAESPFANVDDHQAEQLESALRHLDSGKKDIIQVRTFNKEFKFIIPLDILIEQQPFSGAMTLETLKEIVDVLDDEYFPFASLSDEKELELMEPLFTYLKFTEDDIDLMRDWDLVDIVEEMAKQKRFDNVYLNNMPTQLDCLINYFTHKDPNMIAEVYRLIKAVIGELHWDWDFHFGLSVMNDLDIKYEKDAELIVVNVKILAAARTIMDFPSKPLKVTYF